MLTLAGVPYSLAEPAAGHIQERAFLYCLSGSQGDCNTLNDENYTLGYNTYFRFPDKVLAEDKDIVLGGFTVIKTTLNNDYLAFGVGVSMAHQGDSPNGGHRYRPVEFGSFVFGSRYPTASMPTEGLAAYAGFAQAYAQSSNRNYLPFHAAGSDDSGIIVSGFSAMVFSFDNNGQANFEHGYIDLSGGSFVDTGTDITQQQALLFPSGSFRTFGGLNASFADLEYRMRFSTAVASVDVSTITNANDFDPNDDREYDVESRSSNAGRTSFLSFHLNGNPDTANDMMDFTVLLVRDLGGSPCTKAAEVVCYASDRADAGRAGKVQLYGATVDLTSDSNNADSVPTFAGGVWQYEGLVFVDHGADATAGNADDRLLGVVDLYGSLGGLVVDLPAE